MAKTIITASLTGAVTPKEINPYIPLTPKEIAEDAVRKATAPWTRPGSKRRWTASGTPPIW